MRLYFGCKESLQPGDFSDTAVLLAQSNIMQRPECGSTEQTEMRGAVGLMNGILFGIYFWVITITIALLVF